MKAQIGLEYMAVLTILIVFIVPLFYIANERINVARTTSEARIAANTIVSSANAVYAQSPGSKLTAQVYIPQGYVANTSYIANKTVSLRFSLANGNPFEAFGLTKGNITGRLPPYAGRHVMTFMLNQNGYVIINVSAG